jgi:small GTP-binding protein
VNYPIEDGLIPTAERQTTNASLLTRYETLRRKESERLHSLLDSLGRVDGLDAAQMEQARDALFHADHPYLIVLMGAFNTGKSSLINALVNAPIMEIGATPTTNRIAIVRHGPALQRSQAGEHETIFLPHPLLEKVSVVDTPGLDSVFKGHDDTTRKFLHRADLVILVMLATQAMSASNVEYLLSLRAYGKRIIVVINQIDLVEPAERDTLKNFVAEQSKQHLGMVPEVWLISSRWAAEAQQQTPRNEAFWVDSGFDHFEQFINQALSDGERVRQKLDTPLQIVRNVMTLALATVREQQDALSDYRRSAQNVSSQLEAGLREQQTTVRQHNAEIDQAFAEGIRRGREAIGDTFQWSRAARLALGGVSEIAGLGGLFRRFGAQSPAKTAFEARKVGEPLAQIPAIADRLGPRLEGRDVKDVDDLIGYTRKELERLPSALQTKVIGKLQPPPSYDRTIMRNVRDALTHTLDQAREVEFKRIDGTVRRSIVALGLYEVVVLVVGIFGTLVAAAQNSTLWIVFLLGTVVLMLVGLLVMPLVGKLVERGHAARLRVVKDDYVARLDKTAQEQIAYGKQMRLDAVAPFMRLVETQLTQIDALKLELEAHQQAITSLEKELGLLRD